MFENELTLSTVVAILAMIGTLIQAYYTKVAYEKSEKALQSSILISKQLNIAQQERESKFNNVMNSQIIEGKGNTIAGGNIIKSVKSEGTINTIKGTYVSKDSHVLCKYEIHLKKGKFYLIMFDKVGNRIIDNKKFLSQTEAEYYIKSLEQPPIEGVFIH